MMRANRFDEIIPGVPGMTKQQIRKLSNDKIKNIFLNYLIDNHEEEVGIKLTETVGDLKRKIESIYKFENGFLNEYKLRIKYRGQREGKLLDEDHTTLGQNHVKSGSTVLFGKEKNKGGKKLYLNK